MMNDGPFFGLDGLDRLIADKITQKQGFFVEVGANDGLSQTNTLYFERIGWKGLLIEPIPELYEKCTSNRPGCIAVNACCTALDDPRSTIPMTYAGLMSVVQGHLDEEVEEEWVSRGETLQNVQRYTTLVPAAPISSILRRQGINEVDLLVVDVEGYEIPLLKGIDYSELRPRWVVCEDMYTDEVQNLLGSRGYQTVCTLLERRFTRDRLYVDVQHRP